MDNDRSSCAESQPQDKKVVSNASTVPFSPAHQLGQSTLVNMLNGNGYEQASATGVKDGTMNSGYVQSGLLGASLNTHGGQHGLPASRALSPHTTVSVESAINSNMSGQALKSLPYIPKSQTASPGFYHNGQYSAIGSHGPSQQQQHKLPAPHYEIKHAEEEARRINENAKQPTMGEIPLYCYSYKDKEPICFTAVEIITFLPRLFTTNNIARRLVNNGMSNPIHFEILKEHRILSKGQQTNLSITSDSISKMYLGAMRPSNWRNAPGEEQKQMWKRKNHKVPSGWIPSIDMTQPVPGDNVEHSPPPLSPSVPFTDLLVGVKKIPQGYDAADLTRAIEFACAQLHKDSQKGQFLFPDDLVPILNYIGRTPITDEHQDQKVVARYKVAINNRKRDAHSAAAQVSHQPGITNAPGWELFRAQNQPPPLNFHLGPMDTQPRLSSPRFLRDYITPKENDSSLEASIIRFAQRPDQISKQWCDEAKHVDQIRQCLEGEAKVWVQKGAYEEGAHIDQFTAHESTIVGRTHFQHDARVKQNSLRDSSTKSWKGLQPDISLIDPDILNSKPSPMSFKDIDLSDEAVAAIPMDTKDYEDLFGVPVSDYLKDNNDLEALLNSALYRDSLDTAAGYSPLALGVSQEDMCGYEPTKLIRECSEAADMEDYSKLARAARVSQRLENVQTNWYVKDMLILLDLE